VASICSASYHSFQVKSLISLVLFKLQCRVGVVWPAVSSALLTSDFSTVQGY
jgi:hypothetical protein